MARVPLMAGNWKMHKTRAEARAFAEALPADAKSASDLSLSDPPSNTQTARRSANHARHPFRPLRIHTAGGQAKIS